MSLVQNYGHNTEEVLCFFLLFFQKIPLSEIKVNVTAIS